MMLMFYLSIPCEDIDKLNFEQIYHKYHNDIYKRTYGILNNENDVKDAMQETWLGVLKHIKIFRNKEERSIKAYIMAIARNQAISIIRAKQKERELLCDADITDIVDDAALVEVCEQEGVSGILECIQLLSAAQRDVMMMYYYYNHSLKEIAQLFGISESVATSRWAHGRERLMSIMKRKGYYEE